MASSTIRIFDDPDSYYTAIRAQHVEGVVTAPGNFRAELTRVDFDRIWMQRADESLARVLNISTHGQRTAIFFVTDQDQPAMHLSGVELSSGEIAVWDSGTPHHHWSEAACRWGSLSLPHPDLAVAGKAMFGREWSPPPPVPCHIRPPGRVLSRLLDLHQAASDLAKTAPDTLAHRAVARAMEQALLETMVLCLAGGDIIGLRSVHRHHAAVMRRFEAVLEVNPEGPLHIAELCTATGTSYPTLRACCQEHLGMSPKRYLLLRRMHLARRALRRADPESVTVTRVATEYGFWELGRFAVVYRSLFGESPSATLRRPPEGSNL